MLNNWATRVRSFKWKWKGKEICHLGILKGILLKYFEHTYHMALLF